MLGRGGQGRKGGEWLYATLSQADSYLVPARHAQEEAEGPSQGGACPGPQVLFQLFTAAKRQIRDEEGELEKKTEHRDGRCPCHRDRRVEIFPTSVALPDQDSQAPLASLFMRKLQTPPRSRQPPAEDGRARSLSNCSPSRVVGERALQGAFPPLRTRALCRPFAVWKQAPGPRANKEPNFLGFHQPIP